MSSIGVEVLLIVALVLANGLFAMSEMALVAARKSRLQQLANEGRAGAQVALELVKAPDHFLSTVQMGVTVGGVLAGAYGGATIAEKLTAYLTGYPALAHYGQAISLGIVVVGITYLSLVVGELAPKRLALANPERIAAVVARPMRLLSVLAYPAVRVLSLSARVVLRMLGVRPSGEPPITEEEIKILLEQGTQAGVFAAAEQDMVERVFRLSDRRVSSLLTPRTEIVWLNLEDPPQQHRRQIIESRYRGFPVAQGSLDNVLGMVEGRDLLARALAGEPLDLRASLREPLFVPESKPAMQLLRQMRAAQAHCALVIDEYGGLEGLVTVDDLVSAIIDDVPLVGDSSEPQAVQREDGSWLLDGLLSLEELRQLFDLEQLPDEGQGCQTLGGLAMATIGHIPQAADTFELAGLRFEVVDMDGHRVDKVLVKPLPPAQQAPGHE